MFTALLIAVFALLVFLGMSIIGICTAVDDGVPWYYGFAFGVAALVILAIIGLFVGGAFVIAELVTLAKAEWS